MAKQNYNLNFSEAQDYISKRGLDVVWNDCDIFIDERHITESVANVLKWADEQYRTAYVVTRSEDHSDYVETIFYDRNKAIEYCTPFNQKNSYGRDITILVDGEEKGRILCIDEIYKKKGN